MTVYKESDCASPCNEALRELQVIDIFYQQASTVLLTRLLFSTKLFYFFFKIYLLIITLDNYIYNTTKKHFNNRR